MKEAVIAAVQACCPTAQPFRQPANYGWRMGVGSLRNAGTTALPRAMGLPA